MTILALTTLMFSDIISIYLTGQDNPWSLILAALLIYPAIIAWNNANILESLTKPHTFRSFAFAAVVCVFFAIGTAREIPKAVQAGSDSAGALTAAACMFASFGVVIVIAAFELLRVRDLSLDSYHLSPSVVLKDLNAQRRLAVGATFQPGRPLLGVAFLAIGMTILVGQNFIPTNGLGVPGLYLLTGTWALASLFLLMARSAFEPTISKLLTSDQRPPVVWLRSFADEQLNELERPVDLSLFDPSLEARLARHFSAFGPYITPAASKPNRLAIGAAREQLAEEAWRQQIVEWIDSAAVILLTHGTTPSVDWELSRIIEQNACDRLIIAFPPVEMRGPQGLESNRFAENMTERLSRLQRAFARTLWGPAFESMIEAETLRALTLRPDGTVVTIRAKSRTRDIYYFAALAAHWFLINDTDEDWRAASSEVSGSLLPSFGALLSAMLWFAAAHTSDWGTALFPFAGSAALGALFLLPWMQRRLQARIPAALATLICAAPCLYGGVMAATLIDAALTGPEAQLERALDLRNHGGWTSAADADRKTMQACAMIAGPAAAGLPEAEEEYAYCLQGKWAQAIGDKDARYYLIRAANAGRLSAVKRLATMYIRGAGGIRQIALARPYLIRLAEAGKTDEIVQLAIRLELGRNPNSLIEAIEEVADRPDPAAAAELYKIAASHGNYLAKLNLGTLFFNGSGVKVDKVRAKALFEEALMSPDAATSDLARRNLALSDR